MSGAAPVQLAEDKTFWQKYKWWILVPIIIVVSIGVITGIVFATKGSGNEVTIDVSTEDGTSTCTKTVNGVEVPCNADTSIHTCTKIVNGMEVPCDS